MCSKKDKFLSSSNEYLGNHYHFELYKDQTDVHDITFFNFEKVKDNESWTEFLNDTFDFGEFHSDLFDEDGNWSSEEFLPIGVLGVTWCEFDDSTEEPE